MIFKRVLGFVFGIAVFLIASMCYSGVVSAVSGAKYQESIVNKAVYQGVNRCYLNGGLESRIELGNFHDISDMMSTEASDIEVALPNGMHSNLIGFGGSSGRYDVRKDKLTCEQLFVGSSDNKPLLEATGNASDMPSANNVESFTSFFKKMGYEVQTVSDMSCYYATFSGKRSGFVSGRTQNKICQRKNGELFVEGDVNDSVQTPRFEVGDNNEVCFSYLTPGAYGQQKVHNCAALDGGVFDEAHLMKTIKNACGGSLACPGIGGDKRGVLTVEGFEGGANEGETINNYNAFFPEIPGGGGAGVASSRAIEYLSHGDVSSGSLGLSRAEKRILYQDYLMQYYGFDVDCNTTDPDGQDNILWYDSASGQLKTCYLDASSASKTGDMVNGVSEDGFFQIESIDAAGIIDYLNSDTEEYEPGELEDIASGKVESTSENVIEDCRNSGAGNTLGWILCPILEIMGDAAIGMYDDVVEPQLRVKSQLFSNEEQAGSVPYAGWQQFRDIANVAFVVLLLVVIFSQLTGVGIDNYGIKRILPKLVIAIVLINLSYLVCMLLVDISNIVGNGIQNLFDGLGNGLTEKTTLMIPDASPKDGGGGGIATTGGNIVAVGLLAGLAFMTGPIWLNPITLFSLLFSALGVVISLVFLFLLLSVRQAAIVVLVVVSPVVVVCNILPNTKSLFDRWVKLFKTLLMVYPIAGLLVGGGNYVSKLLLAVSPDSFPMALTAMVMGIAPIFFLPGVLKDAMAMLGKVGATLNGLGDRAKGLSNKASSAIMKSEPMKNMDREFQLSRARGTVKRLNKKGNLTGYQARKLAANASMLEKDEKEEKAARVFAFREKYKNESYEDLEKATKNALKSGNEHDSYGLLGAMNYIYGAKKTAGFISGFYGETDDEGNYVNDLAGRGSRSKNRRKSIKGASEIVNANSGILAELKENNKDIADMVASAGMDGDTEQSLVDYTRKMATMEESKWLTQEPKAIQRASKAGALRPETAASVLNKAQNPNSSYGGALKGKTRAEMENILSDAHSGYSRDASGRWVPSTPQPAPGGGNNSGNNSSGILVSSAPSSQPRQTFRNDDGTGHFV